MKTSAAALLISLSTVSAFSAGYLNNLASNSAVTGGAGFGSYLDNLPPSAASPVSGGGISSYLDTVSGDAPAVTAPAPVASTPAPAPVAAAPVSTSVPVAAAAPAVGDYLSSLPGASSALNGGGISGYLDALPSANTQTSGSGIGSYLDVLAVNAAAAGGGIPSYADALLSTSSLASSGAPSPASGNLLENIYHMIMQLDAADVAASGGQLSKTGGAVAFSAGVSSGADAFAMSFVKK